MDGLDDELLQLTAGKGVKPKSKTAQFGRRKGVQIRHSLGEGKKESKYNTDK